MSSRYLTTLLFFLLLVGILSQNSYKKITPNIDPQAKCLDGSPGILYVHQGSEKNKFLLFFYGGGTCAQETLSETLEDCLKRSKTQFGSSTFWPDTLKGQGYLSLDPSNKFANWTKVIFPYCDGMVHQGYVNAPYEYKGAKLYVRGAGIVRQNLKYITDNYNFTYAEKVVMTGFSAGAMATHLWSNYFQQTLKNTSVLDTIIDSGIFMNVTTYNTTKYLASILSTSVYKFANVNENTPLRLCNLKYIKQPWKCFWLTYAFTAVNARMLIIDSSYDTWEIFYYLNLTCVEQKPEGYNLGKCSESQLSYIEKVHLLRNSFYSTLNLFSKNSIWAISCSNHVFACRDDFYNNHNQQVPMRSNFTVKQAVQRYVFGGERVTQIDKVSWPNNTPCSCQASDSKKFLNLQTM